MEKKWQLSLKIKEEFKKLFPEIHPIILQLIYNLGLTTQEKIDEFLLPDYSQDIHNPFLFSEMEKVVKKIIAAVQNKEKITIYGDYDADGVTATAILFLTLKKIGAEVDYYLPDREKEGYGLNEKAIKQLVEKGTKLLVTVDLGISNEKEVELANELGLPVIVTDHHLPPKILPSALAILNPKLANEKYPFKDLAGVGVAFKLAQAILRRLSKINSQLPNPEAFEKWLLDLVAIGTVTDMMPLLGENRTLVKYGLIVLNKTPRLGLRALIKKAGLNLGNLDSENIAYQLGPRFNAAGRINHAKTALDLILTESVDEAEKLAENLEQFNQQRQKIVNSFLKEIQQEFGEDPEEKLLIFFRDSCPVGTLGLLASKIVDIYHRPSLVISRFSDKIQGAGRSINQFNLIQTLREVEKFFSQYGGHTAAVGFILKENNLDLLKEFSQEIKKIVSSQLKEEDLIPFLFVDVEVDLKEINWSFYEDLEKFRPFGKNNSSPIFLTRNLIIKEIKKLGKDGQHLKIMVNNRRSMIAFSVKESINYLKKEDKIDVVFEVRSHEWNGTKELELKIIDLKKV